MANKRWIGNDPSSSVSSAQCQALAALDTTELGAVNGVTAGTVTASKAIVVDASKQQSEVIVGTTATGTYAILVNNSASGAVLKVASDTDLAMVSTSVGCSADAATSKVSGYVKVVVDSATAGADLTRYLWLYSAKRS